MYIFRRIMQTNVCIILKVVVLYRQGGDYMQVLTGKQQKVFEYLRIITQSGLPPTVREICAATGIKSTSTVHGILNILEDEGYIRKKSQNARGIYIEGGKKPVNVPLLGRVTAGLPI